MITTYTMPGRARQFDSGAPVKIEMVESSGFSVVTYKDGNTKTVPNIEAQDYINGVKRYIKAKHRQFKSEGGIFEGIRTFFTSWVLSMGYLGFITTSVVLAWLASGTIFLLIKLTIAFEILWLVISALVIMFVTIFIATLAYVVKEDEE